MAIAVERKSKNINWFAIAIGGFVLLFVSGTVYYLFISTPPGIDKIIPPPPEALVVKNVNSIINSVNMKSVVEKVTALENPISAPIIAEGELGRSEPFLPI